MPGSEQHSGILGLNPSVNQKENPYIPGSDLWQLQGWYLNEALSIQKRLGFQKLNTSQLVEAGSPATFTGLFEYLPSNPSLSNQKLATTLTGVYKYNPSTFTWDTLAIPSARTGTHHDLYAARMLFDQLYLGGGGNTDINLRFNGSTVVQMGITPPSSAPIAGAATVGGNLALGTYSWKITYVNELNQESNPSSVSNSVTITTGGNNTVPLTIPKSPDSQVVKRNLYRTTANGATWLLITTINENNSTSYSDGAADSGLGIANEQFAFGVPPHFSIIEIYKGYAFMAGDPNNKSYVWFSGSGAPAQVNSNDFRGLDPNDGDVITGMIQFQSTIAAFKGYSIWVLSGQDRGTFGFAKQVTHVGAVNNACLVEIPLVSISGSRTPAEGKVAFLSPTARFYFFDGTTAAQTAVGLEPILNQLDKTQLNSVVGAIVPSLNQARWIVPSNAILGYHGNNLIIWYDYVLDKWGTTTMNLPVHYAALLHDNFNVLQYYVGGTPPTGASANLTGGYVYQGDIGGSDDGISLTSEVIDKGHPRYLLNPIGQPINYPTPENIKVFNHFFIWYKTLPVASTIQVWGIIDDPTNIPVLIGTISGTHPSGQEHLHMNLQGRRLYIRITETSTQQGLLIRGWKVHYKDVGRHTSV